MQSRREPFHKCVTMWYTRILDLVCWAFMPKSFKHLLEEAGMTTQDFRRAVYALTNETISRDRTSRWFLGKNNPGPVVRAFLILISRLPKKDREKLIPPHQPD